MAWRMPEGRCCPSCGYRERILITQTRGGFRLSCGWCAHLGEVMDARRAFFLAWGAPRHEVGATLNLEGVPAVFRGRLIESVPLRVVLLEGSALIAEHVEGNSA